MIIKHVYYVTILDLYNMEARHQIMNKYEQILK
jgi:hypothetical protein